LEIVVMVKGEHAICLWIVLLLG